LRPSDDDGEDTDRTVRATEEGKERDRKMPRMSEVLR
jgi:hypothetical protein